MGYHTGGLLLPRAGGAGVSARRQTAERGMESGVYLDLYELWEMRRWRM
jgi:hypothetical protein